MRQALATLPWVETDTIVTDRKTRQARITAKSKAAFNLNEVKSALGDRYDDGVVVLTGPTDQ